MFLISLESSWNVDVWNGFVGPIWNLKHKLWPKEGSGINLTIWPRPIKVRIAPISQVACNIALESSWRGLQLCFRHHHNQKLAHKVMAPKFVGIPTMKISGLASLGTKCHLDVGPVANHRVYYKGEGGGFPQVRAMVSLLNPSLLVTRPNTKNVPTMH